MNQTENNEQTTQQNKTIWKLAVAAFIFAAMFFGANALAGQNVLLNIVCALVLAGAAVFCGRKISSHHKFTTREVAFIGMMSAIVFPTIFLSPFHWQSAVILPVYTLQMLSAFWLVFRSVRLPEDSLPASVR